MNIHRRTFLATLPVAAASLSGCLFFGSAHRGRADSVGIQLSNHTDRAQIVILRLVQPDRTVQFEHTYELDTGSKNSSTKVTIPVSHTEYTLTIELASGRTDSYDWSVSPCSSAMLVEIRDDTMRFNLSNC